MQEIVIRPLVFLDTETTGTQPGRHELLEIGAVVVAGTPPYGIGDSFSVKVRPERIQDADPEALMINHYTAEEWRDAVPEAEAARIFCEKVRGAALWGWNVGFDRAFLEPAMNRAGMTLEQYGLDYTWYDLKPDFIRWAKLCGRETEFGPRFSLGAARRAFSIELQDAHRALPDAIATYQVFVRLEEEFTRMREQLRNQGLGL
ncbi:MAG: 3'-5' exonuclease [Candidatus Terrybacteria bacterium]|nr:3'-5' exonuclease [Candidatus Terrybacteria bacterium]